MTSNIYVLIEHLRGQVAEISYMLLAAANELVNEVGGEVVAVLLGHNARELSKDLKSKKVFYVDHPELTDFTSDGYLEVLQNLVNENPPRVFLFGHTSIGMDLVSGLGVRVGLPVVSQCKHVYTKNGNINFISQICGGKIMAEGDIPAPTALVSMVPGGYKSEGGKSDKVPEVISVEAPVLEGLRVNFVEYIEPSGDDIDISKENILIAVGRGLQKLEDLELVEELAAIVGGTVCASRPIIDQGWLPSTRLVGKSGKAVKPKFYLALGISGAPEHVEAISDSELIVAINTDPEAQIFNLAKFAAQIDMIDFIPVFIKHIQKIKAE